VFGAQRIIGFREKANVFVKCLLSTALIILINGLAIASIGLDGTPLERFSAFGGGFIFWSYLWVPILCIVLFVPLLIIFTLAQWAWIVLCKHYMKNDNTALIRSAKKRWIAIGIISIVQFAIVYSHL